jgi:glycosyltransferase involved in cell wall biosynthesis
MPLRHLLAALPSDSVMTLRVLHIVDRVDDEAGSPWVSITGLIGALRELGVVSDVAVARWQPDADIGQSDLVGQSDIVDLKRACDVLKAADIVHIHADAVLASADLLDWKMLATKPTILSPCGAIQSAAGASVSSRWKRFKRDRRIRSLLTRCRALTALNQAEADGLGQWAVRGPAIVLPYGVSPLSNDAPVQSSPTVTPDEPSPDDSSELVSSRPDIGDQRVVLFLGPIEPTGGIIPLMRSVGELGHDFRGWKLVLAGPDSNRWKPRIEAALRRKRALDRVMIASHPDQSTQRWWLNRASILVSPSTIIRCPVSAMLGMSAGLPTVTTDHGLPAAALEHIQLCDPDRDSVRDTLRPLMTSSEDELGAMGRATRDSAMPIIGWDSLAPRFVELYQRLV